MVSLQMGSFCLFICTFLVLLFIQTGEAIKCYECNSHNDSRCANEEPPESFKKDCTEHKEGSKFTLCRKITQSIDFEVNGLKPDVRVIRLCGWDVSNYVNKCYHRSGFGGRQEVCTCSNDLCNKAGRYETSFIVVTVATILQLCAANFF